MRTNGCVISFKTEQITVRFICHPALITFSLMALNALRHFLVISANAIRRHVGTLSRSDSMRCCAQRLLPLRLPPHQLIRGIRDAFFGLRHWPHAARLQPPQNRIIDNARIHLNNGKMFQRRYCRQRFAPPCGHTIYAGFMRKISSARYCGHLKTGFARNITRRKK